MALTEAAKMAAEAMICFIVASFQVSSKSVELRALLVIIRGLSDTFYTSFRDFERHYKYVSTIPGPTDPGGSVYR
jgi:hypothetical protein